MARLMRGLAEWLSGPQETPEPAVVMYTDTFVARLPSMLPGADFEGRFTISWYGRPREHDADLRAIRSAIPQWAARLTARISTARPDAAQRELGAAIAQVREIVGTRVRLAGANLILTATVEAQRMAQEWEHTEQQRAAGRLRRQLELDEIAYLREEIFSRPDTARCYWLKHHPNALNEILDDRFERIAETLKSSGVETQTDVARVVTEFLGGLTDADRGYLLDQLARVFSSFDRQDLAERLPGGTTPQTGKPHPAQAPVSAPGPVPAQQVDPALASR